MYAVVATGGKQLKVATGDVVDVEKLDAAVGQTVNFDVIFLADEGEITVDSTALASASVTAEVIEHFKGEKAVVFKFKKRKGYKRLKGHRQNLTRVRITAVSAKPAKKAAEKPAEKPAAKTAAAKKPAAAKPAAKPAAAKKAAAAKPAAKKPAAKADAAAEKPAAKKAAAAKPAAKKPAAKKAAADKPAAKAATKDKKPAAKAPKAPKADEKE
jgi:large subunit ribosomal protein L21